jgi:hypothetical protein
MLAEAQALLGPEPPRRPRQSPVRHDAVPARGVTALATFPVRPSTAHEQACRSCHLIYPRHLITDGLCADCR